MRPLLPLALCLAGCLGCATGQPGLLQGHTNTVAEVVTSQAPEVTATTTQTPAGTTLTTWKTNLVTVTATNWTTNVSYTPSATATNLLNVIAGLNNTTAPMNPFAPIITAVLAVASAGLGAYATHKTSSAALNCHSEVMSAVLKATSPPPPPKS